MEFALGRIYAKFYICQILNSTPYIESKTKELEFQQLIEDNMAEMEECNKQVNENIEMKTDEFSEKEKIQKNESQIKKRKSEIASKNKETISSLESNPQYKRYFVYKKIIYSKCEIQGLVIEKRKIGYEDRNTLRHLIYIDDTTGVIQAIAWNNKSDAVFNKIEREIVSSFLYLRIFVFLSIFKFAQIFELILIFNFLEPRKFHQSFRSN
jgi:hypothetical protein